MLREFFRRHDVVAAISAGLAYGVLAQLAARVPQFAPVQVLMSFGYVFVLPWVLAAITARGLRPERGVFTSLAAGLGATALCLLVAGVVGWEGSICLVMAAPLYFALAAIGALFGHFARRRAQPSPASMLAIAMLPLLSASVEGGLALPTQLRTVHNAIEIDAPPAAVWHQIIRVPAIVEPQQSWFFAMGFPRPVEATLSHEGVGGVRHASFERGLLFIETVKSWEQERAFRFDIAVDPKHTPLTTLDAHVTVGGAFFDVLEGGYRIEPLGPTRVRLHLDSRHRISTRFNLYTALWSDALMSAIQQNILRVIQSRAEREL